MKARVIWTWPDPIGGYKRVYLSIRLGANNWIPMESHYRSQSTGWQDISQRPTYILDRRGT